VNGTDAEIARVFREEAAAAVAVVARAVRDLDIAEDAVQDAFTRAVASWPARGVPDNPAAWITATAKNAAIDRLRGARRGGERQQQLEALARIEGTRPRIPRRRSRRWTRARSPTTGCG
jgi:RNA polymerase sigma-70 factor (ECF subfamily)